MKRLLLASAFAALPLGAHAADLSGGYPQYNFIQDNAPSQPAVVGHLSLGLGYANEEFTGEGESENDEYGIFAGVGRANVDFGWLNLELDAGGQAQFKDGSSWSTLGVTGHLWGSMSNLALGVYGSVNFPTGATIYTVGGEIEAYLGSLTLGAAADYNWPESGGVDPAQYWTNRGWADLYLTPNTKVGAEIFYGVVDTPGGDIDVWAASVGAEHRFAGTPVSAWIEGSYLQVPDLPGCAGCKIDQWVGLIGFRVFMDAAGTTLHEHEKAVPWVDGRNVLLFGVL